MSTRSQSAQHIVNGVVVGVTVIAFRTSAQGQPAAYAVKTLTQVEVTTGNTPMAEGPTGRIVRDTALPRRREWVVRFDGQVAHEPTLGDALARLAEMAAVKRAGGAR